MRINNKFVSSDTKLDFKDVLITPRASKLKSRKDVDLRAKYMFKYSKNVWSGVPLMSANMDTVTDLNTFNVLRERGWMSCFPKHMNGSFASNMKNYNGVLLNTENYALTCGIRDNEINQLKYMIRKMEDEGIEIRFICLDVANGYMERLRAVCESIRTFYPYITIIAGNVVTPEGVRMLVDSGVDIVKVGIGSGSLCETRIKTGVGCPQFSAVLECADEAKRLGAHVISDGGILCAGDVVKAFSAGADFVMMGSILSGHVESPGEEIYDDNTKNRYKVIYGMSSKKANELHNGGLQSYRTSEGKTARIKMKGTLTDTMQDIEGGIRSACTYTNSMNIMDLYKNTNFIRVNSQYSNVFDKDVI